MNDQTGGKLTEAVKFARQIKDQSLIRCLKDLKSEEKRNPELKIHLANDFAPRSFYFERFRNGAFAGNGGIIFHGQHDGCGSGSAPTFSVTLSPTNGWRIHT